MKWFCFILLESSKLQYIKVTCTFHIVHTIRINLLGIFFVTHCVMKFRQSILIKLEKKIKLMDISLNEKEVV